LLVDFIHPPLCLPKDEADGQDQNQSEDQEPETLFLHYLLPLFRQDETTGTSVPDQEIGMDNTFSGSGQKFCNAWRLAAGG
jgi:hypothetical protein